jgi:hypothetical protein
MIGVVVSTLIVPRSAAGRDVEAPPQPTDQRDHASRRRYYRMT